MSIAVLPQSTVRTLVSTQVLLTPGSIVKELVDNALDGGATSISLEIDDTTVSYLCVRDNGSGIPYGEDRDLMCLRHTTSKIESFDDLQTGKVETLGFRGEALASLAEIAGKLEITTRAKGDVVAEKWTVSKDGRRLDTRNASQTQGTTVTAYAIFQSIPVRKETYIKESKKALISISRYLRAVAMLRRGLRVTFKVRRPISVPSVFSGEKTLVQSVRVCLGKDAVSHSEFIRKVFDDEWAIEAVLPKCDNTSEILPKSSKKDFKQVVYAVDGRPLNISLPTAKKLSKLTKKYLRSSSRELILCHISTPAGRPSYDVNVEPAKDDVLFYHETGVLAKWAQLLESVYPEGLSESCGQYPPDGDSQTEQVVDDFESYIRRDAPLDLHSPDRKDDDIEIHSVEGDREIEHIADEDEDPTEESSVGNDTSTGHDNGSIIHTFAGKHIEGENGLRCGAIEEDNEDDDEEEDYRQDVNLHNPWVIAKLNRIQKPRTDSGVVSSGHNRTNSTPWSLGITSPRNETAQALVASWNPDDETATPVSKERCREVYRTPLSGDNAKNFSSDSTATSPIKKFLPFSVLSPSNTSLTQPSSPVENSPTRQVHGCDKEGPPQSNSGLATVPKKRSFLKMANLEQFMGHADSGDSNDNAEEVQPDSSAWRRNPPSLRSPNKSHDQNESRKRYRPVQSSSVPLEFIPRGEETYPYLVRLGYNGATDMTDILDSDASLVLLAEIQEQLRGSLDPYWLRETGESTRCWDGASVKRLVLSIAEKSENAELKKQIGRMDMFRGDKEWMVFA
ncbi:hypothetical protein V1522DRAFT_365031 [Lipomyces starkeyi]